MNQILGIGWYQNKLNLTKVGGATMGGFPPNGPSKIQTFYPFKLDT